MSEMTLLASWGLGMGASNFDGGAPRPSAVLIDLVPPSHPIRQPSGPCRSGLEHQLNAAAQPQPAWRRPQVGPITGGSRAASQPAGRAWDPTHRRRRHSPPARFIAAAGVMGFVSALRSALASVVKPLTGRKRKAWEDEDEEVAPPVPESASRPRLQHHHAQEGEAMAADPPQPQQQPQPQQGTSRPLQQRLDFSSPAVAAQQRRGTAGAVGALHPRSLHQERPPQLPAASMGAAGPAPGSSGAPLAPASTAGPFSKRFAPPTAQRHTPAPRARASSLAANVSVAAACLFCE